MHRIVAPAVIFGLALAACPANADDCRLRLETSVPMGWDTFGRPTVPFTVSGTDTNLIVDTGGVTAALAEAVARKLGLNLQVLVVPFERVFGGINVDTYVVAKEASFGRLDAPNMNFAVLPDIALGLARAEDGLFAAEILRGYEAEFDFAGGRLNLFSQKHCPGRLAYWTHDTPAEIPFRTDHSGHIQVTVQLDGHDVDAEVDTGSADTVIDGNTAASIFGIDLKTLTPATGAPRALYPFKRLSIGGMDVSDPAIGVVPRGEAQLPGFKMLIGMNILRQLRMIVSYGEEKIYVTAATAGDTARHYDALSAGLSANMRGVSGEAINAFSVALQGNALPANSLTAAHLGRADAELKVGRCQDALADADAALMGASASSYAHYMRGAALDCLGRQPEAGDEYSALIESGVQPGAYAYRGWLLWRSGDSRAAESDFTALLAKEPLFGWNYVWLAMVRARLGLPTTDLLIKAKRIWGTHTWGGSLFALYDGEATPEDVLGAATSPDETCQSDFYVAEWWLAQNNRAAARPLLENAAAHCPHDQEEWRSAGAELARLNP